ncbi:MAG: hypothetical protein ACPLKP_01360 [Microgenomates group bacterium]
MAIFLSFFICLSSVFIYLFSYFWKFNHFSIIGGFLFAFLISLFYLHFFKKNKEKEPFIIKIISLSLFLIFLMAIAFILSPLIIPVKAEGFTFLRFPGIGDYNKHLYVTGAIYNSGIPPRHPYYPSDYLSYYFGYYIIPASLSLLFKISPQLFLFFFIILTSFLSFSLIKNVIYIWVKNSFFRILSLSLIIIGTGLDIIPTIILEKIKFGNTTHIEYWAHLLGNKLMITNTSTAILWTPQHFFVSALTVYLINYLLINKKIPLFIFSIFISFILFSSSFVAFTFFFWIFLILIFERKARKDIIYSGLFSFFLSFPFILFIFKNRTYDIFNFEFLANNKLPLPKFLQILSFFIINFPIEFGIVGILTLFLGLKKIKVSNKNYQVIFLGVIIPLIIITFIVSSNWNDFGMRTILPIQLVIPIILFLLLEKIKSLKTKKFAIILIFINIIVSSIGTLWEFYWRWKERKLFTIEESLLYLKLRQEEKSKIISTLDNSFWTSYIPVISFHSLYSPSVYDSRVYLNKKLQEEIDEFNNFLEKTFINPSFGKSPNEIINEKNKLFQDFPNYIKKIPPSLFILRKHNSYVIRGWLSTYHAIFEQISTPQEYSLDFSTFNIEQVKEKINKYQIFIEQKPVKEINPQKNNKIFLKRELYFLIGCKKKKKLKILKF